MLSGSKGQLDGHKKARDLIGDCGLFADKTSLRDINRSEADKYNRHLSAIGLNEYHCASFCKVTGYACTVSPDGRGARFSGA